jgi:hypothetical protein
LLSNQQPALTPAQWSSLHVRLQAQLDRDQNWSRHLDTKLGPIIATDGVLIGFAIKYFSDTATTPHPNIALEIGIGTVIAFWSLSVIYAILAISPKLTWQDFAIRRITLRPLPQDQVAATQIFFDHIARYPDPVAFAHDALPSYTSDAAYAAQLFQQVHSNARVATDKALQVRWSVKFLFLGVLIAAAVAVGAVIALRWGG